MREWDRWEKEVGIEIPDPTYSLFSPHDSFHPPQVKRSRENQRRKKQQHEDMCDRRARENEVLENELQQMRDTISFLVRAVGEPNSLSAPDQARLQRLILERAAGRQQERRAAAS